MPFNDTTLATPGLIQLCEDWTSLGNGAISGDSTNLKQFTNRINEAFSRLMPLLLSNADYMRWDDSNNVDLPIATVNIVSGQSDYEVKTDADSLNILNLTDLMILPSSTATTYAPITRMTLDHPWAPFAMSPNSNQTGTPSHWLENGNVIFLFPQPNYSVTNGIKLYFERDPAYFTSSDTTKKPGIPRPFHALLALYASLDFILQNRSTDHVLISRLEAQIQRRERELENLIASRNPTRNVMSTERIAFT